MVVLKDIALSPVKDRPDEWDDIEQHIKTVLMRAIYVPLLKVLKRKASALKNSAYDVICDAIVRGVIQFHKGSFAGKFNASISRELKDLGAKWDRKTRAWKIPMAELPYEVRSAISVSGFSFQKKIDEIDRKLAQVLPEEVADKIKLDQLFDRTIWKVNKRMSDTLKGIQVGPNLTRERSKKIAKEWENNLKLYIQDFTKQEVKSLRSRVKETILSGNRYESLYSEIQKSYGVSARKAKFLARQETGLLMAKFTETRYKEAGVKRYKWGCVKGTAAHPVRPAHKALEGKIFSWDNPPITTAPGEPIRRNNPKQDYNCRCFAIPIVTFKGDKK